MNGGGAEREGDTESETLQAPSHQPRARRRAQTHGPRDRDLAEVGRLTDCATRAPLSCHSEEGRLESRSLTGLLQLWGHLWVELPGEAIPFSALYTL